MPVTLAVNCAMLDGPRKAYGGETLTATWVEAVTTVTVAEADCFGLDWLVACSVTGLADGSAAGAV